MKNALLLVTLLFICTVTALYAGSLEDLARARRELARLETELEQVLASNSYSMELAVTRLRKEIEDVRQNIRRLEEQLETESDRAAGKLPVLAYDNLSGLFQTILDYCQSKVTGKNEEEKLAFQFMLDRINSRTAMHIAADFSNGTVRFVEPQVGIHSMELPMEYTVHDPDLCLKLREHLAAILPAVFAGIDTAKLAGAELLADLGTWGESGTLRNQLNLKCSAAVSNGSATNPFQYNGKALIIY